MSQQQPVYSQATSALADEIATRLKDDSSTLADRITERVRVQLTEDISKAVSADVTKEVREHYDQEAPSQSTVERAIEASLFFTRWFMSPAYACLVLVMCGLVLLIIDHTLKFLVGIYDQRIDSVAQLVDILDLMLIGSLLVMVMIGGFENTISKINKRKNSGPTWVGNLEMSHLKIKVAASVVLISGVHLLKFFLSLGLKPDATGKIVYTPSEQWDYNILAAILIHIVFIMSVLLLAWVDKILHGTKYHDK